MKKSNPQKIVLTGGGSAGHVTPNIALIDVLRKAHWQIDYIGSKDGVEKAMIVDKNIPYHAIRSGKLRRYFSWQNFIDPINIFVGICQAYFLLRKLKPHVVFSKGGYVALPVVVAAKLNHIPVVAHESDMTPGLANRLCFPFVDKLCVTFADAKKHFKDPNKVVVTGTPLREQLFQGDAEKGLAFCHFKVDKPCLLVMGGGHGSIVINRCVRQALDALCQQFNVIHLCGHGKIDKAFENREGYCQLEYANEELPDLFAASQLVVSRAGANSLSEILALTKPHVLIPLSLQASRGDQIQNARYFQRAGISIVVDEENLTPELLLTAIAESHAQREDAIDKMRALQIESATSKTIEVILAAL